MPEKRQKAPRPLTGKLLLLSAAALGLWLIAGVAGGLYYRDEFARSWRTPKLAAPVVVIESDDWGLDYRPPRFVPPSKELDAQQADGIERLVRVLEAHRDAAGRKPIVSAFVVVRQADTPAIAQDPEFRYHARPIDQTMPRTVAALQQAAQAGVFHLAYHGRDHRDAGLWALKVRRAVEQARDAGRPFDPAVVTTFHPADPRGRDRSIAEYFDSRRGYLEQLDQEEIDRKVRTGLDEFQQIFGRKPTSTVAPRYLWGPKAEAAWSRCGIRYVHGVNKQGGAVLAPEAPDVWSRPFGVRLGRGLVGIPRTADVEATKDSRTPSLAGVLAWADRAVATGEPIVLCTHAYNYYGPSSAFPDAMARCLDEVLTALERRYPALRYLSADEVGRLADTGKVSVAAGTSQPSEIRAAGGLQHVWLWLKGIYLRRPKARLYATGLGALILLVAAAGLVRLAASRARRRRKTA